MRTTRRTTPQRFGHRWTDGAGVGQGAGSRAAPEPSNQCRARAAVSPAWGPRASRAGPGQGCCRHTGGCPAWCVNGQWVGLPRPFPSLGDMTFELLLPSQLQRTYHEWFSLFLAWNSRNVRLTLPKGVTFSVSRRRAPHVSSRSIATSCLCLQQMGPRKRTAKAESPRRKAQGRGARRWASMAPRAVGGGPGAAGGRPHDSCLPSQRSAPRVLPPDCIIIDSDNFKCILCWAPLLRQSPRSWFSLTKAQSLWTPMRKPRAQVSTSTSRPRHRCGLGPPWDGMC